MVHQNSLRFWGDVAYERYGGLVLGHEEGARLARAWRSLHLHFCAGAPPLLGSEVHRPPAPCECSMVPGYGLPTVVLNCYCYCYCRPLCMAQLHCRRALGVSMG